MKEINGVMCFRITAKTPEFIDIEPVFGNEPHRLSHEEFHQHFVFVDDGEYFTTRDDVPIAVEAYFWNDFLSVQPALKEWIREHGKAPDTMDPNFTLMWDAYAMEFPDAQRGNFITSLRHQAEALQMLAERQLNPEE